MNPIREEDSSSPTTMEETLDTLLELKSQHKTNNFQQVLEDAKWKYLIPEEFVLNIIKADLEMDMAEKENLIQLSLLFSQYLGFDYCRLFVNQDPKVVPQIMDFYSLLIEGGARTFKDIESLFRDLLQEYGGDYFGGRSIFEEYRRAINLDQTMKNSPSKDKLLKEAYKIQLGYFFDGYEEVFQEALDNYGKKDLQFQKDIEAKKESIDLEKNILSPFVEILSKELEDNDKFTHTKALLESSTNKSFIISFFEHILSQKDQGIPDLWKIYYRFVKKNIQSGSFKNNFFKRILRYCPQDLHILQDALAEEYLVAVNLNENSIFLNYEDAFEDFYLVYKRLCCCLQSQEDISSNQHHVQSNKKLTSLTQLYVNLCINFITKLASLSTHQDEEPSTLQQPLTDKLCLFLKTFFQSKLQPTTQNPSKTSNTTKTNPQINLSFEERSTTLKILSNYFDFLKTIDKDLLDRVMLLDLFEMMVKINGNLAECWLLYIDCLKYMQENRGEESCGVIRKVFKRALRFCKGDSESIFEAFKLFEWMYGAGKVGVEQVEEFYAEVKKGKGGGAGEKAGEGPSVRAQRVEVVNTISEEAKHKLNTMNKLYETSEKAEKTVFIKGLPTDYQRSDVVALLPIEDVNIFYSRQIQLLI